MDLNYELWFENKVFENLITLSKSKRKEAVRIMDRLRENPFFDVDTTFYDAKGRPIYKSIIGSYLITFSVDHAIKEVKIHELLIIER